MKRPIAFILAACQNGMMIVNRNDYHIVKADETIPEWYTLNESGNYGYGIGHELLNTSEFSIGEINLIKHFLDRRRKHFGDGVVAIDVGANIGTHTIEWARHMTNWGTVTAFEAQEVVFYALAGNIVLNNCLNARAKFQALGAYQGRIEVPNPNYFKSASFGSIEIHDSDTSEDVGQEISRKRSDCNLVPIDTLDNILEHSTRLDFLKIDVEGMELEVLIGAKHTIINLKPIIFVETIKSDKEQITDKLSKYGYKIFERGINILAIHESDPILLNITEGEF